MTTLADVTTWVDGYRRAWESNDPADVGALFTEDAEYYIEPYNPPYRGREQIVQGWLDRRDEPGESHFEWKPLAITDEVAIIQGTTTYPHVTYSNLWVIRLDDDGRCREFTEWWMDHAVSSNEEWNR